jgi:hypothetical protein
MLNDRELRAVAKALKDYAVMQREDVIGVFIKQGSFRYLSDKEIVELSKKLEAALPSETPEGGTDDVGSPSSS